MFKVGDRVKFKSFSVTVAIGNATIVEIYSSLTGQIYVVRMDNKGWPDIHTHAGAIEILSILTEDDKLSNASMWDSMADENE